MSDEAKRAEEALAEKLASMVVDWIVDARNGASPLYQRIETDVLTALRSAVGAPRGQTEEWQPIHEADLSENRPWSVIVYVPGDDGVTNGVVGEARYHEDTEAWMWAGTDPTDHWAHPVYPTQWRLLPASPQQQRDTAK